MTTTLQAIVISLPLIVLPLCVDTGHKPKDQIQPLAPTVETVEAQVDSLVRLSAAAADMAWDLYISTKLP